jgi:hypothetical protein
MVRPKTMKPPSLRRFPLLALGLIALAIGLWTGLLRLGLNLPSPRPGLAAYHGPLMVSGFLGTLIGLERAVGAARWWPYGAPMLTGLGTLTLLVGLPAGIAALCMTLGSLVALGLFAQTIRRQPTLYTAVMGLGALTWLVGNGLWLAGWPLYLIVPWWIGFLTLTIAGERLELSRLLQLSPVSRGIFLAAIGLFMIGLIVSPMVFAAGGRLSGLGLVILALWLLYYDLARRSLYRAGLTRFIAVCMLSGYVWLGGAGLLGLWFGALAAGPAYDAMLHAFFLGFVFVMIFGHAPIIFPAVLGVAVPFHARFYAHLVVLHLSLALRLWGDLSLWWPARQWSGVVNVVAVLLFFANTGHAIVKGRRQADRP